MMSVQQAFAASRARGGDAMTVFEALSLVGQASIVVISILSLVLSLVISQKKK
ncbi:putative holin-like toxin [Jeotgalibacillus aurantiacus]|uniref:putative holin-like toxin n=1 Tax=Jeotgalibacillus aurantiacus TaxID=2763266 RepID=UPI00387372A3